MKRHSKETAFTCSKGFWLLLAVLIYLDGQGVVLWALLACALHECSHWLTICALGGRVCALRLSVVGAEMKLDPGRPLSYPREAAAALAGPVANLLVAAAAARSGCYLFAGLNLCFGALNLVPVFPLDGGRAMQCVLYWLCPRYAEPAMEILTPVFSGLLLGLGYAAWRGWGNLSLMLVVSWLLICTLKRSG